ncbi:MAG: Bug family tripartite tricarboxylate transporter substrate binding protein [Pseudorhodoplanes sp.]|uniref:Bug family tripartite tricarboxylate transporter substrate binding protein n=1 Tax=Pseudorhodoplanes sp. TaxID=1934341 RepID=UPI003D0FB0AC
MGKHALRLIAVAAIFGIGSGAIARASELPSSIKLVVPYPPGGGTDAVARLVASSLGTALGVPMIVENRSGGATVPATDAVAKSPADGGTLLFVTDTFGINDAANKQLPYDTIRDFRPIAKLVNLPMVLSGSSQRPTRWKSMDELVKFARSNPGKVTFGSLGSSSPHELTMAYFAKRQGINILNVPYRGTTPALQDLVAGQIDITFTNVAASEQFNADGKIYRIAVTSPDRAVGAKEVETAREQGYPDLTLLTWFGIVAPAGMPPALVERYYREIEKISQSQQLQKLVASIGGEVSVSGPDSFLEFIKNDVARYRKMIEETGIKVE